MPVTYSQATRDALADELAALPPNSLVAIALVHYFALRAQALACANEAPR